MQPFFISGSVKMKTESVKMIGCALPFFCSNQR